MSSTRVQFLQDGVLHSIDLPGRRNPKETERLQEYIQNTAFGTTNLLRSMSQDSIDYLRNYYCWSDKIIGGVFDGLTREEAQFLREHGWTEDRQWYDPELTDHEMHFLCEQDLQISESIFVPSRSAGAKLKDDEKAEKTAQGMAESKAKAEEKGRKEEEQAKQTAEKCGKIALGAVRDGRPTCSFSTPASSSPSSSSSSSSSSAARSVGNIPDVHTSSSAFSSPLARLVEASSPLTSDNEETGARPAKQPFIPFHKTLQHEQAHGLFCPFKCEYSPAARAFRVPGRTLPVQGLEGVNCLLASPRASPPLAVGRLVGLGIRLDDEEVPVVDWARESRRWRFSRGGQRGDPDMDCYEW